MATRKKDGAGSDGGALLSMGQTVTVVIGYPDGGSETIHRGTVVGTSGPLVIKKEEQETVVNTTSFYFIKAAIEE